MCGVFGEEVREPSRELSTYRRWLRAVALQASNSCHVRWAIFVPKPAEEEVRSVTTLLSGAIAKGYNSTLQ